MGLGDFFKRIGRGIGGAARKVGQFIKGIDLAKVGQVAKKVGDIAGSLSGTALGGVPILGTILRGVKMGADVVQKALPTAQGIQGALQEKDPLKAVIGGARAVAGGGLVGGKAQEMLRKGADIGERIQPVFGSLVGR